MSEHTFWGNVSLDMAGYSAGRKFVSSHFSNREITIYLGNEFDDEGEYIECPPSAAELAAFQRNYELFIGAIEQVIEAMKDRAFVRYKDVYAAHYEDGASSDNTKNVIATQQQHFAYMQDVLALRLAADGTIVMPIRYELDEEHGLEIRLKDNEVISIGGIAET